MRIATYNVENLDDTPPSEDDDARFEPTFQERLDVLRPSLARLRADVICFQEINGQRRGETSDEGYELRALRRLLEGTAYRDHQILTTLRSAGDGPEFERNLVTIVPPDWTVEEVREILHDLTPRPQYRRVMENAPEATDVVWERPLFYVRARTPGGVVLHLINVHFKSKIPTNIDGQKINRYTWRSAAGWAEGYFLSSMKRVGAALEARVFLDTLFDADPGANIVLAGDLNAEADEVPVVAVRGEVSETNNPALNGRVMFPVENSVPDASRYTLFHHGRPSMLDHLLVSRPMMAAYRGTEIHNETLPDETIRYANDAKFPQSDHAPVVATFDPAMLVPRAEA